MGSEPPSPARVNVSPGATGCSLHWRVPGRFSAARRRPRRRHTGRWFPDYRVTVTHMLGRMDPGSGLVDITGYRDAASEAGLPVSTVYRSVVWGRAHQVLQLFWFGGHRRYRVIAPDVPHVP